MSNHVKQKVSPVQIRILPRSSFEIAKNHRAFFKKSLGIPMGDPLETRRFFIRKAIFSNFCWKKSVQFLSVFFQQRYQNVLN